MEIIQAEPAVAARCPAGHELSAVELAERTCVECFIIESVRESFGD
jgi:hypothetical protein